MYGVAYKDSFGHSDEAEFIEHVVFGVCLCGGDYERHCCSLDLLTRDREETVFLFARIVWLWQQGASPHHLRLGL